MSTKFAHFVDRLEKRKNGGSGSPTKSSHLGSIFSVVCNSYSVFSFSIYNHLWLAGYKIQTVNKALIGRHILLLCSFFFFLFLFNPAFSTTQTELAKRVFRGLSSTGILLVISLVILQFSRATVGHTQVRKKQKQKHKNKTKQKTVI